ncbi:MAG: ATP-binding protein [Trichlorobacter sp.]|jgi:signal transduction histidine kinase|nr:ATP-binding protein [Trichlorobacter sp.]
MGSAKNLSELFDTLQLQQVLDSFHDVTDISVALIDLEGMIIASSVRPLICLELHNALPGQANGCHICQAQALKTPLKISKNVQCPYGLLHTVVPLVVYGEVWGSMVAGQVRDSQAVQQNAEQNRLYDEQIQQMVEQVPIVERHFFDKAVVHLSSVTTLLAEQVLARHTSEQQQQLIRHYAELSEEADRIKSEILNNLSHELRTPLNGIIGGAQLLGFTPLTPKQTEYLAIIEESSRRELALIDNLLEMVNLKSSAGIIIQAPFLLQESVDEVMRMNSFSAQRKGLYLFRQLPEEELPLVHGDKVHLRQVLHALTGNAIKFTEAGSVTLSLEILQQDNEKLAVRFCLTDTGTGIEASRLDSIFEPFIQADMSTTRSFNGLGLGLALCRQLAELMGGRLCVKSEPGKGSTFCLELSFPICA